MPTATLLSQGNEILTGEIIDTNANWLASELWSLGISVRQITASGDITKDISKALVQAKERSEIVITTGGLGPTNDDLTAEAAAVAFNRSLRHNPEASRQIESRFSSIGRTMAPSNLRQANLPEGATILENHWGTAPGFIMRENGSVCFFLPGVPHEMRMMFSTYVAPIILETFHVEPPATYTIRVVGHSESRLADVLGPIQSEIAQAGGEIGYRAAMPEVQVKLRFNQEVSTDVQSTLVDKAVQLIGPRAFGTNTGDLAQVVGQQLAAHGATIATAESCTAGKLASWLASVPGASRYLLEGAIVYSNEAKTRTCGVSKEDLNDHGAVSKTVALQLASGIRKRAGATWGVGITGIAGPTGGTNEKPIGTVHIGIAGPEIQHHKRLQLHGDRDRITTLASAAALQLLLAHL